MSIETILVLLKKEQHAPVYILVGLCQIWDSPVKIFRKSPVPYERTCLPSGLRGGSMISLVVVGYRYPTCQKRTAVRMVSRCKFACMPPNHSL